MFRKLISNLPFSPSLIDQVALYSKQLKHESRVRKMGLTFMVSAVTIQLLGSLLVAPLPHTTSAGLAPSVLGISTGMATHPQTRGNNISTIIHSQEATSSTSRQPIILRSLPRIKPVYGLVASFSFIGMATFFYARGHLMARELDIVKADITSNGGI